MPRTSFISFYGCLNNASPMWLKCIPTFHRKRLSFETALDWTRFFLTIQKKRAFLDEMFSVWRTWKPSATKVSQWHFWCCAWQTEEMSKLCITNPVQLYILKAIVKLGFLANPIHPTWPHSFHYQESKRRNLLTSLSYSGCWQRKMEFHSFALICINQTEWCWNLTSGRPSTQLVSHTCQFSMDCFGTIVTALQGFLVQGPPLINSEQIISLGTQAGTSAPYLFKKTPLVNAAQHLLHWKPAGSMYWHCTDSLKRQQWPTNSEITTSVVQQMGDDHMTARENANCHEDVFWANINIPLEIDMSETAGLPFVR